MGKLLIVSLLSFYFLVDAEKCGESGSADRAEIFVPAADITAVNATATCKSFFGEIAAHWWVRTEMPEYYQPTCYKWSENLERMMRDNVACLQTLSRAEVVGFFGTPTVQSSTRILYGTSPTCDEDFFSAGTFGIYFKYAKTYPFAAGSAVWSRIVYHGLSSYCRANMNEIVCAAFATFIP